jgi:hypothetical protein
MQVREGRRQDPGRPSLGAVPFSAHSQLCAGGGAVSLPSRRGTGRASWRRTVTSVHEMRSERVLCLPSCVPLIPSRWAAQQQRVEVQMVASGAPYRSASLGGSGVRCCEGGWCRGSGGDVPQRAGHRTGGGAKRRWIDSALCSSDGDIGIEVHYPNTARDERASDLCCDDSHVAPHF